MLSLVGRSESNPNMGSNWHDVMNSAMAIAGWEAAFFFLVFYILSNLVLMDLLLV
jgi:hypothetical protein